jgi:hypothetical protein
MLSPSTTSGQAESGYLTMDKTNEKDFKRLVLQVEQKLDIKICVISKDEIDLTGQIFIQPDITAYKPLQLPFSASARTLKLLLRTPPPLLNESESQPSLAQLLANSSASSSSSSRPSSTNNNTVEMDSNNVDVGRVVLGQLVTVKRVIFNPATQSPLAYRLDVGAPNSVSLSTWAIAPREGVVTAGGSVEVSIVYQSKDSDVGSWHDITVTLVNVVCPFSFLLSLSSLPFLCFH